MGTFSGCFLALESAFPQPEVAMPRWLTKDEQIEKVEAPFILVVEPDPDCRHILSALIAHAGYRVERASSGEAGLDSAVRLGPTVIVGEHPLWLDDATTLCAALRANPITARIPFVAVTSRALPEELEHARRTHGHVFPKPPEFRKVVGVVSDLMERAGRRRRTIGRPGIPE